MHPEVSMGRGRGTRESGGDGKLLAGLEAAHAAMTRLLSL